MLLKDVLAQKSNVVRTISPDASFAEVIADLVRFNIGSLLVRDTPNGPILGIITERDILKAQAAHRAPLEQLRVATFMTRQLIVAQPDDDTTVAMRLMTTHRVRHLPVVAGEELFGLVSIGDIVKVHHDELEMENQHMRSYIQGGASAAAPLM
jgi:CBS domain-containing protein